MSTADWAILIPALAALITATAGLITAYGASVKSSHTAGKMVAADQVHTQLQAQITDLSARVNAQNGNS